MFRPQILRLIQIFNERLYGLTTVSHINLLSVSVYLNELSALLLRAGGHHSVGQVGLSSGFFVLTEKNFFRLKNQAVVDGVF